MDPFDEEEQGMSIGKFVGEIVAFAGMVLLAVGTIGLVWFGVDYFIQHAAALIS